MNALHKQPKPKKSRYFFREWRLHRKLSQEKLAEQIGQTAPSMSQLENGKQGFSEETLLALAAALECHPAELLGRDPNDNDSIWGIWERIPIEDRPAALKALRGFALPVKQNF